MARLLILLALAGLVLAALLGCEGAATGDLAAADADSDSDGDGDTDADSDVDIIYPEHINPLLNLDDVMTGPISPPPEDFGGLELAGPDPDGPPLDRGELLLRLLLEQPPDDDPGESD